jgi:hypothetical protein
MEDSRVMTQNSEFRYMYRSFFDLHTTDRILFM